MPNLTKAQRAAKVAAEAAAASATDNGADKPKDEVTDQTPKDESGAANGTSAQDGAGLEGINTTAASETDQAAADTAGLDATNTASVAEFAPMTGTEIAAAGGIDTAAIIADQDAPTAGTVIGFPLRACVRNNTRMPVQVPALHLDLPASGETTITIYSEGDFRTLHSDLTALFSLNGFGEDAFAVGPAETTEA